MKTIRDIAENEMIAEFLAGELESTRFGAKLKKSLKNQSADEKIITNPDLGSGGENELRKRILEGYRKYKSKKGLFSNFPDDIHWQIVTLSKEELGQVRYINWDYWLKLSNDTRLPIDAVKNIKSGVEVYDVSNQGFLDGAKHLKDGGKFPKMILVGKDENSHLTVLEGHSRLTAYHLELSAISDEIEVIVGFSNNIDKWGLY